MAENTILQGHFENGKFFFPARVYYEDTDAGGIVYYANYLKFAERARTEFIRSIGLNQQSALEAVQQAGFVVRRCNVEYLAPAVLDDILSVSCEIKDLGGASATMYQEICRGNNLLVRLEVQVVYVLLKDKRPTRIPPQLKQLLTPAQ